MNLSVQVYYGYDLEYIAWHLEDKFCHTNGITNLYFCTGVAPLNQSLGDQCYSPREPYTPYLLQEPFPTDLRKWANDSIILHWKMMTSLSVSDTDAPCRNDTPKFSSFLWQTYFNPYRTEGITHQIFSHFCYNWFMLINDYPANFKIRVFQS